MVINGSVGITGHQTLTADTRSRVMKAVREYFRSEHLLIGVTSLAAGADQICGQAMLDLGGHIIVVLPASNYESSFVRADDLAEFHRQLACAHRIVRMPFDEPSEEAYWAAGKEIVDQSAQLVAIWDGQPAAGLGGTADVVRYARESGKRVCIVWPEGARRT